MILTSRDINALKILSSHKFMTSKQLACLAYPDPKYETARKRIEELHKSKYIDFCEGEFSQTKGRPSNILFLSQFGKNILSQYLAVDYPINYGKSTKYSRRLYYDITQIVVNLVNENNKRFTTDLSFKSLNEFEFINNSKSDIFHNNIIDGILSFRYRNKIDVNLALKYDNGKLRLKNFIDKHIKFVQKYRLTSCIISPDWTLSNKLVKTLDTHLLNNSILFTTKIEFETKPLHQIIFKNAKGDLLKLKYLLFI